MAFKPKNSPRLDPDDPDLEPIEVDTILYGIIMVGLVLTYATLAILGFLTWNLVLLDLGLEFKLGYWFFVLIAIHVFLSLWNREVPTDKLGALYFFGNPIRIVKKKGLVFVPWGLVNLDLLPADLQEILAPGKRDQIYWGDDDTEVPDGMVRAIRMTTKAPEDAEKDPLDAQLTVGLGYFVLWTIKDPVTFRAHIRTIEEADSQLRLMSTTALSEIIATMTASQAIENQSVINNTLDNAVRDKTKSWGVEINNTGLTQINLSHALATAMRDRAKARFEAQTQVINAEAQAKENVLLGESEGIADRARAAGEILGRVDGMKAMAEELKVDGASVLAAEATRGIFKDADTVVVGAGDGLRDVLGAVSAGKTMFKNKDKKEGDDTNAG